MVGNRELLPEQNISFLVTFELEAMGPAAYAARSHREARGKGAEWGFFFLSELLTDRQGAPSSL